MHGLVQRHLLPLLLLPLLAGAQEPSGLEKAKQEIKTLPAVRSESERTGVRLPSFTAPSPATEAVTPSPGAPQSAGSTTAEADKTKASGNWLVDAMMKEEARAASRKSGKGRDELTATDRTEGRDPLADPSRRTETAPSAPDARDRATALAVDNPLAPFMADWISKRDQDLLLPKTMPGLGDPREGLGTPVGPTGDAATITFRGLEARPDPATGPALRPAPENPFLQAVLAPEKPAPAAAPTPAPANPIGSNPALTPPEPARDSRTPPPIDLSKPSQDAKYFPQLKRF